MNGNRFRSSVASAQDRMIAETVARQDSRSRALKNAATAEATINARYGLAQRNYLNLITGFPEWFR